MSPRRSPRVATGIAALTLAAGGSAPLHAQSGEDILADSCAGCHAATESGGFGRIDAARKTPEAWDATVVRMMRNHGVALSPAERVAIVRHLAETRGLSIAETEGWRYILEREPVAVDEGPDQLMTETCGRCHSYARVALQRRTEEDWAHLMHFHLGQYPTLEYQALARDRDWWTIAQQEIVPYLAETYPLGEAPEPFAGDLSGRYIVAGHQPGRGAYTGTLELSGGGADGYDLIMALDFADGRESFEGTGIVHGAGEWRATLTAGDRTIRQVMALRGDTLSGRWFVAGEDVTGGRLTARPAEAGPAILSAIPAAVSVGQRTEVTLTGTGLSGAPDLPRGVSAEVVRESPEAVVLALTATEPGRHAIALGDAAAEIAAYEAIDRIEIVPDVTIARIGGNGGPIPKVPAQFEAMAFANGADGEAGTADDLALGPVDAAWRIEAWDDAAAAMGDAEFAGTIDDTGRFIPGPAGPNPMRVMNTNNTGNLRVVASYEAGGTPLTAEAQLYATVQRFVDAALR